jgi:hypothetical protein
MYRYFVQGKNDYINVIHLLREQIMKSVKEESIRAIASLPDNAQIDDVMYRLYVIDKVAHGQAAIKEGRTIPTAELLKEIESW